MATIPFGPIGITVTFGSNDPRTFSGEVEAPDSDASFELQAVGEAAPFLLVQARFKAPGSNIVKISGFIGEDINEEGTLFFHGEIELGLDGCAKGEVEILNR